VSENLVGDAAGSGIGVWGLLGVSSDYEYRDDECRAVAPGGECPVCAWRRDSREVHSIAISKAIGGFVTYEVLGQDINYLATWGVDANLTSS
jgi:hypothetical protein